MALKRLRVSLKRNGKRLKRSKIALVKKGVPRNRGLSKQAGFPKQLKMVMRYCAVPIQINCTTGATATYAFSCNSLYDPDTTGGGHQPLYFDQMSLIYNKYVVIGSKIKLQVQTTEDPIGPSTGVLWIDDDTSTSGTNLSYLAEQSSSNKLKNFGGANSPPNTTFVKRWSAKKHFGGSILANVDLRGSPSASPTDECFFKFSYNTMDNTSATAYVTYTIEYIVVWLDKKEIAQS